MTDEAAGVRVHTTILCQVDPQTGLGLWGLQTSDNLTHPADVAYITRLWGADLTDMDWVRKVSFQRAMGEGCLGILALTFSVPLTFVRDGVGGEREGKGE